MTTDQLNDPFGLPGAVAFEPGPGGLTRAVLRAKGGEAHVMLHGAHVAHWQPAGQEPALFMSGASWFENGRPIRGGVPVCWPWFGRTHPDTDAPGHGLARLREWEVENVAVDDTGRIALTLLLHAHASMAPLWPHAFELRHTTTLGDTLTVALETRSTADAPFTISEALHTYFAVADVRRVSVAGLQRAEYLDETIGFARTRQEEERITFAAETDRAYVDTDATCVLTDPALGRTITIEKTGSQSTVVWNPWVDKARAMPDFGDDEWPRMVCIETANAFDNAVTIDPGAAHTMAATLRVDPL